MAFKIHWEMITVEDTAQEHGTCKRGGELPVPSRTIHEL